MMRSIHSLFIKRTRITILTVVHHSRYFEADEQELSQSHVFQSRQGRPAHTLVFLKEMSHRP